MRFCRINPSRTCSCSLIPVCKSFALVTDSSIVYRNLRKHSNIEITSHTYTSFRHRQSTKMSTSTAPDIPFFLPIENVARPVPARIERGALTPAQSQYKALLACLMVTYYQPRVRDARGTCTTTQGPKHHMVHDQDIPVLDLKAESGAPVTGCKIRYTRFNEDDHCLQAVTKPLPTSTPITKSRERAGNNHEFSKA